MILLSATGERLSAELTCDHPASSYGRKVLVVGDDRLALGPGETFGLRLAEVSPDELSDLVSAGYCVPGAESALSGPDDTLSD